MFSLLKRLIFRLKVNRLKFSSIGKSLIIIDFPIYIHNSNTHIGNDVVIYPNVMFWGEGKIIIGNDVKIGNNVMIHASSGSTVHIKDQTIIAANTYIIDSNHNISKDISIQDQGVESSPVSIGPDCWIGASCVIGKGANIMKGAVIGANSFVNSEIPEYAIAVGSPAKIIKFRI
ncbi:MAG: acyltransferase [Paramuribaculum sp.]|nr:acyltransferase [Paramuribaculum sp.]